MSREGAKSKKSYLREYYLRNRERILAERANDPNYASRRNEIRRAHYARNREKVLSSNRARVARNIDRVRELARDRYRRDRLNGCIRSAVRHSLRGSGAGRRTWDMLGYTLDELKTHIERQFLKGMTWDNYGEWHVDHIVPLSSFTITEPDDIDFARAWALTNLRPLWASENMRKKNDRLFLI